MELAYKNITEYENELSRYFLNKIWELKHVKVHGIKNTDDVNKRTPTFGLTIEGKTSQQVAEYLAKHGIFAWSGHFYVHLMLCEVTILKKTDYYESECYITIQNERLKN